MSVIARAKSDLAKCVVANYLFAVHRSRLQSASGLVHHQCILVVKVHGGWLAYMPNIVPYHYFIILEQLLGVRSRKGKRIAAGIRDRRKRMVLKLNDDGASTRLTGDFALSAENRTTYV